MATTTLANGVEKHVFFPELRSKAEIWEGDRAYTQSVEMLKEHNLPSNLLPLKNVIEGGWVKETGFVWMVVGELQKVRYEKASREVKYDQVVTAIMMQRRLKELHGVKAKDLGIWVPVNEILVDEKKPDKVTFKSIMGITRTHLFEHFCLEEK